MNRAHLTLSEIATAAQWPADDARRRHLDECARCRMLAVRHQQFVTPPVHLPAADVRDAEERLAAFLDRTIGPDEPRAVPCPRREAAVRRGPFARVPAPAFALAAGVLIVAGALLWSRPHGGPAGVGSGVLRGQSTDHAVAPLPRLAPVTLGGGRVELRWRALPGAERYEVRLFSGELRTLAVLQTTGDTALVVSASEVRGASRGDTLLWRVAALRGEVRIAQSDLGTLRLP